MMADHPRPLAALRPVAAGPILDGRERGAIRLSASQDVVHVRRVAAPVAGPALVMKKLISVCCACPALPPSDNSATATRIDKPDLLFISSCPFMSSRRLAAPRAGRQGWRRGRGSSP